MKIELQDLKRKKEEQKQELEILRAQVARLSEKRRDYIIDAGISKIIRFGIISDTQIGSRFERLDALEKFLRFCASQGIYEIYHAGDVLDGWKVYRGQEFELYAIGYGAQLIALEEKFPKIKGMRIHFITGNHDASIKKLTGANVGKDIERARPDFHFLGEDSADITIKNKTGFAFKITLIHPAKGTAYALSYHPQKFIEALPGGTKPHLIIFGHYHKAEFIPDYRNVCAIQAGCFQSQTPFLKTRGLAAQVGGWIVEIMPTGKLTHRFKAEWVGFFEESK